MSTIILSLCAAQGALYAAGPEGLFAVEGEAERRVEQPQASLSSCAVAGEFLLAGGSPYGVAVSADAGASWQAALIDMPSPSVICLATDPEVEQSGVVLAGTQAAGVIRSDDRGQHWTICNVGLRHYAVAALCWTPPAPVGAWPRWSVAFAATDGGIYRSPNGGLAWKACAGLHSSVQALAVSPYFHDDGVVLAGTEADGLWRSTDGGRRFERVAAAPSAINALAAAADGWFLSDPDGLWHSTDGLTWTPLPGSQPAWALLPAADGLWVGGEHGVSRLAPLVQG